VKDATLGPTAIPAAQELGNVPMVGAGAALRVSDRRIGAQELGNVPMVGAPQPTEPYGSLGLPPPPTVAEPDAPWGLPADCGGACPPTCYASASAVLLLRATGEIRSLSASSGELSQDGDQVAGRFTIGRIGDCLRGWEASYVGPLRWTHRNDGVGPSLFPGFAAIGVNISNFLNAQQQHEVYRSELHSLEVNKKWWGWDVISTSVGLRYFNLDEGYRFDSVDLIEGSTGTLSVSTHNHLIGPQIGMNLYYPLGRWTTSLRGKAGMYANFVDGDISLANGGAIQFANDNTHVQFGVSAELGYFLSYRLTQHLRVTGGYEMWYVWGLATATGQTLSPLTPDTGSGIHSEEDVLIHGASLGVEINW
jgi:hypothetical protein